AARSEAILRSTCSLVETSTSKRTSSEASSSPRGFIATDHSRSFGPRADALKSCLRRLILVVFLARLVQVHGIRILIEVDQFRIASPGDERLEQLRRVIVGQQGRQILQNTVGIDPPVRRLLQARRKHLEQAQLKDRLP